MLKMGVILCLCLCLFRLSNSIPITSQPNLLEKIGEQAQNGKYLISDIKNDVHNYFYNYNLSFVDDVSGDGMMARSDVDVDTLALDELNLLKPENTHYDKETVTNLMIIGAAGYLLSYLPKEVFKNLIQPLEDAQAMVAGDDMFYAPSNDVLYDQLSDYMEPASSFIQGFAVPAISTAQKKRRTDVRREDVGFFENIGNQIRSIFWKEEPRRRKSVKKELREEKRREARLENIDYSDDAKETDEDEEDEETGFFKSIEKAIGGIFGNPISRASDDEGEGGIGGFVSTMNDVWTDNFSWDYGRFSPKNIIVPSDDRLRYDEEKKLKERGEEVEEEEDIYDEIYSPEINYDDHFMNLHMETDASQPKADVLTPYTTLMTDSLSPPPPPTLQLL